MILGKLFVGAFAELRNVNIDLVMSAHLSVRPSVRMEQLGSHGTNVREI
jgi:hypothetical protein